MSKIGPTNEQFCPIFVVTNGSVTIDGYLPMSQKIRHTFLRHHIDLIMEYLLVQHKYYLNVTY